MILKIYSAGLIGLRYFSFAPGVMLINPSIYVEVRLNSDVFVRPTVADVYTAARVESYTFRQLPTRATHSDDSRRFRCVPFVGT